MTVWSLPSDDRWLEVLCDDGDSGLRPLLLHNDFWAGYVMTQAKGCINYGTFLSHNKHLMTAPEGNS